MKTLIQLILIGILIMCFSRCYNSKKATEQVNKANDKYPDVVAKIARDKYPCTDLLKPDTLTTIKDSLVFVEVECPDSITTETVLRTDTLNNVITRTIRVPVNMPIQTRTITKWYEDSAKIKLFTSALNKANTDNEKLRASNETLAGKLKTRTKYLWWLLALCIGLTVWNFRKLIF